MHQFSQLQIFHPFPWLRIYSLPLWILHNFAKFHFILVRESNDECGFFQIYRFFPLLCGRHVWSFIVRPFLLSSLFNGKKSIDRR